MDLDSLVRSDRRRVDAAFRAHGADGETAFVALVEELTAYLASRQKVLASVVAEQLDPSTTTELGRARARMRVLLLRLGAAHKLGASRIDATIAELRATTVEHLELEARVAPVLARALSTEEGAALAAATVAEQRATAASFRRLVARTRGDGAQAPAA